MQTTFKVTGMSCAHCERAITAEVSEVPGVTGVEVSAATGILTVSHTDALDTAAVIAAVAEAGYSATPAA